MDVDTLIVLFLVAQFKLCVYVFWKFSRRLEKIERKSIAIKKAIMVLHKDEFEELRESIVKVNDTILDTQVRTLGLEVVDEEARKIEEDMWLDKI